MFSTVRCRARIRDSISARPVELRSRPLTVGESCWPVRLFFEGNCVVIDHGQGLLTVYLHLSKFSVKEGDEVSKGQPIALSGGTGRATGPHLHLAVRWQGVYLNPQVLLKLNLP